MPFDQDVTRLHAAPRCGAKTRKGTPCRAPAVRGRKRCRKHGGNNPGPPRGNRNSWKHGRYSAEVSAEKKALRELSEHVDNALSLALRLSRVPIDSFEAAAIIADNPAIDVLSFLGHGQSGRRSDV